MTLRTSCVTLLPVSFFLGAGCSSGGSAGEIAENAESPKVIQLETSGAIPKLDRSPDIAGPDTNTNGVRDDIEAYIDGTYTVASQHAAAMQLAKAFQRSLLVDVTDISRVKAANYRISDATHCVYTRFTDPSSKAAALVSTEIESMTTNTKARLVAYLKFAKALDGTSWGMPEGDGCE